MIKSYIFIVFVRELPKAEIHRHLDGSVRFETIVDLAKYHNLDLDAKSDEELKAKTKITEPMSDLTAVLNSFRTTQKILCSYEAIKRVTFENVEVAYRDGVKLLELRFAPAFISEGKSIRNDEIIEGVLDGLSREMEKYPIHAGVIGILPRTFSFEKNVQVTDDLIHYRKSAYKNADMLCGFDLADDEINTKPEDFAPLVERARQSGLGITRSTRLDRFSLKPVQQSGKQIRGSILQVRGAVTLSLLTAVGDKLQKPLFF